MVGGPDWPVRPDRTDDPGIRRNAFTRMVTAGARRKTKGYSFQFMRVLGINGRLFLPYLFWNSRLMPSGKLTRQQTEAVILRVAWLCRSEYEWTQHRAIGRHKGLTREQVDAASSDPTSDHLDDETRTLLAAVPELLENHVLSDASYDALRDFLSPALILEFIMLVGTYSALAGALNTFGVPLEDAWRQGD
ncbi:MAG: carboxymuconolactone decarboxylase family protein [Thermoleophilaceae bacterium]|nr:carboxymuconolactone decarboxylase family protein [Thermoleophilaceae bacterium]